MIACSHPGRIGDALASLPTVKALCQRHGCQADFYTSDWCAPLKRLMEYQQCIRDFIIPPEYVIKEHTIGIQPWQMPIDASKYEAVYQLGFKTVPETPLVDHIAASEGFDRLPLCVDFPPVRHVTGNYLVACSKARNNHRFEFPHTPDLFVLLDSLIPVVNVGKEQPTFDTKFTLAEMDLLETASLMHYSLGVVTSASALYMLASMVPGVKMITLKPPWLCEGQLWKSERQLVFNSPHLDIENARSFLRL